MGEAAEKTIVSLILALISIFESLTCHNHSFPVNRCGSNTSAAGSKELNECELGGESGRNAPWVELFDGALNTLNSPVRIRMGAEKLRRPRF